MFVVSALPVNSPFIFNALQLPALPSPPTSPDIERDDLTQFIYQFTASAILPPASVPTAPPLPASGLTLAPLTSSINAGDCIPIVAGAQIVSGVPAPTGLAPELFEVDGDDDVVFT